jgi:transposase-like protein
MTDDRMALMEALQKADDGNFLRSLAETVLQIPMEADVEGMIGAGRYERSGERSTWRNGYRDRTLDTRLGQLNLRIPKLRTGSYFPPFLEARKTPEKALVSVIQGEPASRHRFETAGERDRRGLDAESRRPRPGHGAERDQQEPGLEAV